MVKNDTVKHGFIRRTAMTFTRSFVLSLAASATLALAVSACNTMEGAGKDIKAGG
jgi:predicted small secreted protein